MDRNKKARGAGGSQEPDPRGTSVALAAVPDPPVIGRGAQPSVLPQPPIINQQQINPFLVDGMPTPFSRPPMQAPSHPPAHPPACQSGGAGSSASRAISFRKRCTATRRQMSPEIAQRRCSSGLLHQRWVLGDQRRLMLRIPPTLRWRCRCRRSRERPCSH